MFSAVGNQFFIKMDEDNLLNVFAMLRECRVHNSTNLLTEVPSTPLSVSVYLSVFFLLGKGFFSASDQFFHVFRKCRKPMNLSADVDKVIGDVRLLKCVNVEHSVGGGGRLFRWLSRAKEGKIRLSHCNLLRVFQLSRGWLVNQTLEF